MTKLLFAAEQVRTLGAVRNFRVNVHSLMKPDNKYYCRSTIDDLVPENTIQFTLLTL